MENIRTHPPSIDKIFEKEIVRMKLTGIWVAKTAKITEALCLNLLQNVLPKKIIFDMSSLKDVDTAGVWLLKRTIQSLETKGYFVKIENEGTTFRALSSQLDSYDVIFVEEPQVSCSFTQYIADIGKKSIEIAKLARDLIVFLGQVIVGFGRVLCRPQQLRMISVLVHLERFGVNALPLVILMSLSLGVVLAYQGEEQLRRFGAEIYTINLVSISMLREVGILITAILVAGRTGSAITAQIGIMKINQEIDALNALGLSPMEILIIPRILALILVMPLLAFVSDLAGLLGGGIMVVFSLDVSPQLYIHRIGEAVTLWGFWVGIIKAPLFGAIIGVVSCFEGMRVEGTSESVGFCTTHSVVEGIFLVTIVDALLSIFFSNVGV